MPCVRVTRAIVAALVFVSVPSVAAGQSAPQTPAAVREQARWHFGPLYVSPGLRLENLGWDSNVFNEETSERKSDFTFTLTPRANAWLPIGNRALIATGLDLDLVWYANYKDQRSVQPLSTVAGTVFLNRLTFSAGYEQFNTRDRVSNEIDIRARRVERTTRLNVNYGVTPKLTLGIGGERRATDYAENQEFLGEDLERSLDRFSGSAGASVIYSLTPLTTVGVRVDRAADRFAFAPDRDSDSWSVIPEVTFKPRALIRGSVAMGFRWFLPVDESRLTPFRGLVTSAELAYTLRGATMFTVKWGRAVSYSFSSETPYYLDNRAGLAVRHMLGRTFDVLVSSDRHVYDYRIRPGIGSGPITPPDPPSDITWYSTGSVGYRVGRDGRLGVGVVHWSRRSPAQTLGDYERLQFTLMFSYGM